MNNYILPKKKAVFSYLSYVLPSYIGNNVYAHGKQDPTMQIIDMFHAGSPNSVKEHICEMGHSDSHLRIIICIITFGVGIDCKDTCCSIHFGPPKIIESLVQESGRDGKQCISYVLYNGLLSCNCDGHMKHLMQTDLCR